MWSSLNFERVSAAQTLRSLYAEGKEASMQAKSLGISGLLEPWWPSPVPILHLVSQALKIPGMLEIPGSIAGTDSFNGPSPGT